MSYQLKILADAPYSLWTLDGSGPVYTDEAGSLREATYTGGGSVVQHPALVSGLGNSLVLEDSGQLEMNDIVFKQGYESRQFSLEAWVKPLDVTDTISVMSHAGAFDGISIDETHIHFSTKYEDDSYCTASYEYEQNKAFHVVGVHTFGKNSLFVDGVLVAEEDVTDEQQELLYDSATDYLFAGECTDGSKIVMDAPAIYGYPLSSDAIADHYSSGLDVQTTEGMAPANDAMWWKFSDEHREIGVSVTWTDAESFASGVFTDTFVSDGDLVPAVDNQYDEILDGGGQVIGQTDHFMSLPGTWESSVSLAAITQSTINGAKLSWTAVGSYTIEFSLDDGDTWSPAVSNSIISGTETLSTDSDIDIRVTFDGGIEDDESAILEIKMVVYLSGAFQGSHASRGAVISDSGLSSAIYGQPIEYADDNGLLISAGTIEISEDDSFDPADIDPEPERDYIEGLHLWFNPRGSDGNIVYISGSIKIVKAGNTITFAGFSTVTVNGVSVSSGATVFSEGWYHIGGVLSAASNPAIEVGATGMMISEISLAYDDISLAELQQIYDGYLGFPGFSVDDSSVVSIDEPADPADVYSYAWAITAGG